MIDLKNILFKALIFICCLSTTTSCAGSEELGELRKITPENAEFYGIRVYFADTTSDLAIKIKFFKTRSQTNLKAEYVYFGMIDGDTVHPYVDSYLSLCSTGSEEILMSRIRVDDERMDELRLTIGYSVLDKNIKTHRFNVTSEFYDWGNVPGLTESRLIDIPAFLAVARSVKKEKRTDQNWWIGVGVDPKHSDNHLFDKSLECM